jgi:recombination protein RecT
MQTTSQQPQQTAPATRPAAGMATIKAFLNAESVQKRFADALGENKNLFVASIIDLCAGDAKLQQCDPKAIVAEALRAAVLDLPLTRALGFAYIVVYDNKKRTQDASGRDVWITTPTPTFIPGYKGYIQLAMRSGQYCTLNADVVYEGELRGFNKLSGSVDISGERTSDKIVGYFAYFKLLNGYEKTMYMSVAEMAAYAKRYSPGIKRDVTAADLMRKANEEPASKQVGWMGNFNEMAIKTVIRKLISKFGPMSVKMSSVVASDIESEQRAVVEREETVQLAETAPAIDLDNDTVEFEEIDTETGEIRTVAQPAASAPAAAPEPQPAQAARPARTARTTAKAAAIPNIAEGELPY